MEYYVFPIVIFNLGCKTRFADGLRMTVGMARSGSWERKNIGNFFVA